MAAWCSLSQHPQVCPTYQKIQFMCLGHRQANILSNTLVFASGSSILSNPWLRLLPGRHSSTSLSFLAITGAFQLHVRDDKCTGSALFRCLPWISLPPQQRIGPFVITSFREQIHITHQLFLSYDSTFIKAGAIRLARNHCHFTSLAMLGRRHPRRPLHLGKSRRLGDLVLADSCLGKQLSCASHLVPSLTHHNSWLASRRCRGGCRCACRRACPSCSRTAPTTHPVGGTVNGLKSVNTLAAAH